MVFDSCKIGDAHGSVSTNSVDDGIPYTSCHESGSGPGLLDTRRGGRPRWREIMRAFSSDSLALPRAQFPA